MPELIGRISLAGLPSRPNQHLLLYMSLERAQPRGKLWVPVRSVESGSSASQSCYRSLFEFSKRPLIHIQHPIPE